MFEVRARLSDGLEDAGAAQATGPAGEAGSWVRANAQWLRVAVGVLGSIVLLWGNEVTVQRLLWSLLLTVALLGAIQVLIGAGGGGTRSGPGLQPPVMHGRLPR
ncbi:hypothetical protein SAMN04488563_5887 [Jiangella alkaliphila]|uniref:Uncharacterized protein n=2 Tax=Jiangella alkaliphila TaxID=419479 RepID=A0A1H2LE40_9ACTN|nr:hypothetical protein SAMN04488563_5887 [Jiangella alkaliphila]